MLLVFYTPCLSHHETFAEYKYIYIYMYAYVYHKSISNNILFIQHTKTYRWTFSDKVAISQNFD